MTQGRHYDPQTQTFVDVELPTRTIKLSWPERRGVSVRATQGTLGANAGYVIGSLYFSGSHHDLGAGTYSFRVTRLTVGIHGGGHDGNTGQIGSDGGYRGSVHRWGIWHSREGTLDVLSFSRPETIGPIIGGALNPIYSVGPGTLQWGFLGAQHSDMGSHIDLNQSMEGILGLERADV